MKLSTVLGAALATALLSLAANAGEPNDSPGLTAQPSTQSGLAWRCGKNNPAMWGTFGNGCLKQKRNWGKKSSSSGGGDLKSAPSRPQGRN